MFESTVGSLSLRKLEYSPSAPFTNTVIFQSNTQANRPASELEDRLYRVNTKGHSEREDLESEEEYLSATGEIDDEMGELSDSRSSIRTSSRPVTPSHPSTSVNIPTALRSTSPEGIYTLSHKAERLLGLVNGSLEHARACLENARDEIRRTADTKSPTPEPYSAPSYQQPQGGRKDKMTIRAKKAMSYTGFPGYKFNGKVPNVVLGINGSKEEEDIRDRRRKAADGVIYWQREVERLDREEKDLQERNKKR
ncbi:uncharacterized protein IL334_001016 [Kwoniella shivajii]|uniref:Uncharacterized protein n=1 Tax=Kwoniella shivajii TaxID=564305 RepID=A0ABZ1CQS5_9TREE|nr:hypothetical protein IL334_001016 [Kwoniella shivajii]